MTCETEMFLHYVMTANNLIDEATHADIRSIKFDLLHRASLYLNEAERAGAPKPALFGIRSAIIQMYLDNSWF